MTERPARVLAVDLGDVRIGLALSDALGLTAQPLETLRSSGDRQDLVRVCDLVESHSAGAVVVGLPRNLDGTEGLRAERARRWARRLAGRLPQVDVCLWDEGLSSVEAERRHVQGGGRLDRSSREAGRIDALAAAILLQEYLDAGGHGAVRP